MLCEKCGSNPAVITYYEQINGEEKTRNIRAECAMKELGSHLSVGGFDPLSLFPLLSRYADNRMGTTLACPTCGMTLQRFMDRGKFGCADCYETFGDRLTPIFKKLHFHTEHKGKHPEGSPKPSEDKPSQPSQKELWQRELAEAVMNRDYKTAALLKKKIEQAEEGRENE